MERIEMIISYSTDGTDFFYCDNHGLLTRCKDCKYYAIAQLKKDYTSDKRYKPSVCTKGEFAVRRDPDWYCADGEPKEGADADN